MINYIFIFFNQISTLKININKSLLLVYFVVIQVSGAQCLFDNLYKIYFYIRNARINKNLNKRM